jgi:DNA-directed RNA polymerase subunit F
MPDSYLTLAEVKEIIDNEGAKRELNEFQNMAAAHAIQFVKLSAKDSRKLVNELMKASEDVSEPIACKIADLLPQTPDELRAVLMKEKFDLDEAATEAILEKVRKYL